MAKSTARKIIPIYFATKSIWKCPSLWTSANDILLFFILWQFGKKKKSLSCFDIIPSRENEAILHIIIKHLKYFLETAYILGHFSVVFIFLSSLSEYSNTMNIKLLFTNSKD